MSVSLPLPFLPLSFSPHRRADSSLLQAAMLRAASLEVDRLRESCELLRAEVIEAEERERRAMDLLEAKDAAGTVADRNRSGLLQRIRFTAVTFLFLVGSGCARPASSFWRLGSSTSPRTCCACRPRTICASCANGAFNSADLT